MIYDIATAIVLILILVAIRFNKIRVDDIEAEVRLLHDKHDKHSKLKHK